MIAVLLYLSFWIAGLLTGLWIGWHIWCVPKMGVDRG